MDANEKTGANGELTPVARVLNESSSPDLVFFSSVSENTRRFVDRLGVPRVRIPLRPRVEGHLQVARPFVLVLPTYGGENVWARCQSRLSDSSMIQSTVGCFAVLSLRETRILVSTTAWQDR